MKIIVTGENDTRWRDGLSIAELEQFATAAQAAGIPRSQEVVVEVYPTSARTTRKGKLKRITTTY